MAVLERGDLQSIAKQWAKKSGKDFDTAYWEVRACHCGARPNEKIQKLIDAKEKRLLLKIQGKIKDQAINDFKKARA